MALVAAELAKNPLDGKELAMGMHTHFSPDGTLAVGCPAALALARQGTTPIAYAGAGTLRQYSEINDNLTQVLTVERLEGENWVEAGCLDANPDLEPSCN